MYINGIVTRLFASSSIRCGSSSTDLTRHDIINRYAYYSWGGDRYCMIVESFGSQAIFMEEARPLHPCDRRSTNAPEYSLIVISPRASHFPKDLRARVSPGHSSGSNPALHSADVYVRLIPKSRKHTQCLWQQLERS